MKAVLAVLLITAVSSGVSSNIYDDCKMLAFYQELGCTANLSSPDKPCPDQFTCPNIHPDRTKCYYKGKAYADNEQIPSDLISNPCSQGCVCRVYNNEPDIVCSIVDCFGHFYGDQREQCITTYELNSCCNNRKVCGKDAIAGLKSCVVEGKTYLEGQSFEPKDTLLTCVCTSEWDGTFENNTYCRDMECGLEVHHQNQILNKCAPLFYKTMFRCPIGFECESPSSKVIKGQNPKGLTGECTFGSMTLSVGDEVTVEDKCTKCKCSVPPFVTCVQTPCY